MLNEESFPTLTLCFTDCVGGHNSERHLFPSQTSPFEIRICVTSPEYPATQTSNRLSPADSLDSDSSYRLEKEKFDLCGTFVKYIKHSHFGRTGRLPCVLQRNHCGPAESRLKE